MDTSDDPEPPRNRFSGFVSGPNSIQAYLEDVNKRAVEQGITGTFRSADLERAVAGGQFLPPGAEPTQPTAKDIRRPVDAERRRRQRQAASILTRDWLPPTLGTPGLLGIQ
jgi:hypothetical protein